MAKIARTRGYEDRPTHGKTAHKVRFGILPSGGTPRDEAAFSDGVAQSVIAVGAKTEVGYHTHFGSGPPSKIS